MVNYIEHNYCAIRRMWFGSLLSLPNLYDRLPSHLSLHVILPCVAFCYYITIAHLLYFLSPPPPPPLSFSLFFSLSLSLSLSHTHAHTHARKHTFSLSQSLEPYVWDSMLCGREMLVNNSWRCCLSLNVVCLIATWCKTTSGFLYGLYAFSCVISNIITKTTCLYVMQITVEGICQRKKQRFSFKKRKLYLLQLIICGKAL